MKKIIEKEWREVNRSDIPDRVKAVVYTFKQMIISRLSSSNVQIANNKESTIKRLNETLK